MGTDMRRICSFKIKDVDRIVFTGVQDTAPFNFLFIARYVIIYKA